MGNSSGAEEVEERDVLLCLHSVHNVEHAKTESYYGMATNHSKGEEEVAVTSDRAAPLRADINTIISVRIHLHERGSPSSQDRRIGQVTIPVKEMLRSCGPAIFQTWLALEEYAPYDAALLSRASDSFNQALNGVTQNVRHPRICVSLLETTVDPSQWVYDEPTQVMYYEPVMVSHYQHLQMEQVYGRQDVCEDAAPLRRISSRCSMDEDGVIHRATSQCSFLEQAPYDARCCHCPVCKLQWEHAELPARVCTKCFQEVTNGPLRRDAAEVCQLKQDLESITLEANRRIEKANELIVRLKSHLRELAENEAPALLRAHKEAMKRREIAQASHEDLKSRLDTEAFDEELDRLRGELAVLTDQKAALMDSVQEVCDGGQRPPGIAATHEPATEAPEDTTPNGYGNLLPDPQEVIRGP